LSLNPNSKVLIIAYGNPLRCDDGIAWRAAEQLKSNLPPFVEMIRVHQLTPELAEQLSRYEAVIFVDAAREGEPGKISCQVISPQSAHVHFWHHIAPCGLLAMSADLFGATPRAFCVSLSGESFDHGETLSPSAVDSLPRLVSKLREVVDQFSELSALSK
jgi:hydrogenase maturation protease